MHRAGWAREAQAPDSAQSSTVLSPFYQPSQPGDTTLVFESRFEGGNLNQVCVFVSVQVCVRVCFRVFDVRVSSDHPAGTYVRVEPLCTPCPPDPPPHLMPSQPL
jgi:hypothetical protein